MPKKVLSHGKKPLSEEHHPNVALYLPNLMGYIRFLTIIASWKFAMSDPVTFTALYSVSYLLGALDGTVARTLKQCSFFGA